MANKKTNSSKKNQATQRTETRYTARAKVAAVKSAAVKAATPTVKPVAEPITPDYAARIVELAARLPDPIAENTIQTINDLATTGDVRAVEPLVGVLENRGGFYHQVTRAAAAMALGQLNQKSAIPALLSAASDAMAEVSCESILALGALRATEAASALIEIVENRNGFYLNVTRHAAIRALGQMGATSAKAALQNVINNTWEDYAIQSAAQEAAALL